MSRLLDGYRLNGKWHSPKLQTVSFYVDQFPFNDMAREQAAEYGIRICKSVSEAIDGRRRNRRDRRARKLPAHAARQFHVSAQALLR